MIRSRPLPTTSRPGPERLLRLAAIFLAAVVGWVGCDNGLTEPARPAVARLTIAPADTLRTGESQILTVSATDLAGEAVVDAPVTWSSSDTTIATVDTEGRVTAVRQGSADIIALSGAARATARLIVLEAVAKVEVPEQEIEQGARNIRLTVVVRGASGNALVDRKVELSSTDPTALVFRPDGVIEARRAGPVTITATSEGVSGTAVIVIRPAALRRVFFEYLEHAVVEVGGSRPLPVIYEAVSGQRVEGKSTWTTSNPAVATVDSTGVVLGVSAGQAVVSATDRGVTGNVLVHVLRYPDPLRFTDIAVTDRRVCALTQEGNAYCWGALRNRGMLSSSAPLEGVPPAPPRVPGEDGGYHYSTIPLPAAEGLRFTALRLAADVACGLAMDGTVHCWGVELPRTALPSPGYPYVELAVSRELACARSAAGDVDCWVPTAPGMSAPPARTAGGRQYAGIFAAAGARSSFEGPFSMCGTTPTHEAWCWGAPGAVPMRVGAGVPLTAVAMGQASCGLTPEGKAYCWGNNDVGQLGNGTKVSSAIPVEVAGGLRFKHIVVSWGYSCGIALDGAGYCWGRNREGTHGDPATFGREVLTPQRISGGLKFTKLAMAGDTACGIATDGLTYCWGKNFDGELGQAQRGHYLTPTRIRTQ